MGRRWDAPPDPDKVAAELEQMRLGAQYDAKTGGQRARFGYVLDCGCRVAITGRPLPPTQLELFCRNHRELRRILEDKGRLPALPPPRRVTRPAWSAHL